MSVIQKLEDAIHERIAKENAFKDSIIAHINTILSRLPICDNSNASPEVSTTINLSREKLDSILAKLHEYSNINENAAKELVAKLNTKNVRKRDTRRSSLGDIDEFMSAHESNEKDYFSNPANVARAFRLENPRLNPRGVPYANYNGTVTGTGDNEEVHFGGRRTRRR